MTESSAADSRWLVPLSGSAEADVRLVCIPHAGGGAVTFHPWSQPLRPHVDVFAAQLPGRESRLREPPVRTLGGIVEPLSAAVSTLADRPLVVFGHSLGAVIAFEVVQRLSQDSPTRVAALIVSGRPAPHLPSRAPRLAHLPTREIVFRVAELYGNIPTPLLEEHEFVTMLGKVLQPDLEILERYRRSECAPLSCPIAAYGGADDSLVSRSELEAWREHTREAFRCVQLPGDHFYFKTLAGQRSLLADIRDCCESLSRRGAAGNTAG
jgi:medium-chain acyl-[acyl-carrier-protein] hydrolase